MADAQNIREEDNSTASSTALDATSTPAAASSSTSLTTTTATPVQPFAPFGAVLDIEDLHSVTICGVRRPRPPIVPLLCPMRMHLEVGKVYRYCTCGRSVTQPFCDESHGPDDPQPIEFEVKTEQTWHLLCGCKYSMAMPFCDGSAQRHIGVECMRWRSCMAVAHTDDALVFLCECSSHIHAVDGYEEVSTVPAPSDALLRHTLHCAEQSPLAFCASAGASELTMSESPSHAPAETASSVSPVAAAAVSAAPSPDGAAVETDPSSPSVEELESELRNMAAHAQASTGGPGVVRPHSALSEHAGEDDDGRPQPADLDAELSRGVEMQSQADESDLAEYLAQEEANEHDEDIIVHSRADIGLHDVTPAHAPSSPSSSSVAAATVSASDPHPAAAPKPCLSLTGVRPALMGSLCLLGMLNLVFSLIFVFSSACDKSLAIFAAALGLAMLLLCPVGWHYWPRFSPRLGKMLLLWRVGGPLLILSLGIGSGGIVLLTADRCNDNRSLRQIVLCDVMLLLCSSVGVALYALLRFLLPELRLSKWGTRAGKAGLMMLCMAGFIVDLTALLTHGPQGRQVFHFGFSARPQPCPVNCPLKDLFDASSTVRSLLCFDGDGKVVDDSFCAQLAHKPDSSHRALQPCPLPLCACPPEGSQTSEGYACDSAYNPEGHFALNYDSALDSESPLNAACDQKNPGEVETWMALGCRSDTLNRWVRMAFCGGDGSLKQNKDQPVRMAPLPAPFTSPIELAKFTLPLRPCRQSCMPLWNSAILYAMLFAITGTGMAASLFCNCGVKRASRTSRSERGQHVADEEAATGGAPAAAVDAAAADGSVPAAADAPDGLRGFVSRVGHACGWSVLVPWWRHLLLLWLLLWLMILAALSFADMLWLVNANCRDFLIPGVLNAVCTLLLSLAALAVIVRNRHEMIRKREQVFELVGLLQGSDDDEEELDVQPADDGITQRTAASQGQSEVQDM